MQTVKIDITPKKGVTIPTTWAIKQAHPHPDITTNGCALKWRNAGGLFPVYPRPADGLGQEYYITLLRSDLTAWDLSTRLSHAGYCAAGGYGKPNLPPNPGSFALRGSDLGEITATATMGGHLGAYFTWKVRDCNSPSDGERAFLNDNVRPAILAHIEAHAAELKAEAVAELRKLTAERVTEARKQLDVIAVEMNKAIDDL